VAQKRSLLTGAELTRAEVQADPNSMGNWQVAIEFTATGARIFGEVTEQNVGRRLAIILDGTVYSAPRINERIPGGRAVITGQFTVDDARDLAIVLRAGALPAPVVILEERTVGPSLGADSIRQGLIAIAGSSLVVFVFMLVYYRLSGLVADVALGLNLLILFACMAAIRATLTLPGLAGIALTVGMAVDTNILIFERIREEMRVGKTPRAAIEAGFPPGVAHDRRHAPDRHGHRGHPLVLRHQLGQGLRRLALHRSRVRASSPHTSSRACSSICFTWAGERWKASRYDLERRRGMIELFKNPNYDFIGKRKWAYILSAVFTLIGLGALAYHGGLRYDLDFTGGTLIQVQFEKPPTVAAIRRSLSTIHLGESVIQEFGDNREYIIRMPLVENVSSDEISRRVQSALAAESSLGKFEIRRVEFVGPQVGRELQLQAVYLVLGGLVWIAIYLAWRFDLRGGVAAVVAVFHDVIVCLGALSLTNREFSLPVLAALLTIIGYSVNDTIVAYDRLRENRGKSVPRGRTFAHQMNDAVNQTLSRTILTSLTTFFSAAVLLFFGGKTLEDFAFVLFVGVITGTYSTTYIAAALVVDWTNHVEGRLRRGKKAVAKA
jgi:SecD/SecF fusion protein